MSNRRNTPRSADPKRSANSRSITLQRKQARAYKYGKGC